MMYEDIYNHIDPRQFLLDYLSSRQINDDSFSIRKWAKEMELSSHTHLVLLLQGKRKLRKKHLEFLNRSLKLDQNQFAFFESIADYQNAKTIDERQLLSKQIASLRPESDFNIVELEEFEVISNWSYMTILASTQLNDYDGTEAYICKKLKNHMSLVEVRSAITRLMNLNLLAWNEDGKLYPTSNRVTSRNDILDEGVRKYHKQVSDLAKRALDEVDLEQREFQSFTMAVAEDKVSLAKDMVREFRSKLSSAVSGDGDNIYITNLQFFKVTD